MRKCLYCAFNFTLRYRFFKNLIMTLKTLLLKLSNNKDIYVNCLCIDGKLTIKIQESFNFKLLDKFDIDLTETKIDKTKFLHYL